MVDLANKTKTSIDVVRSHMNKLTEQKILLSYHAVIGHTKLGLEFYKSFLYFDSLSKEDGKKLYEFCKQNPNVVNMVRQISPWDIELEIMVENYAKYNEIISSLRELFSDTLRNVESAIMSEDYLFPAKKTIFD